MAYPTARCLTCKGRRVKVGEWISDEPASDTEHRQCDSTRPSCQRCRKASRICAWDPNEETKFSFRSENVFARGQPRRPKRIADNVSDPAALTSSLPPSVSIPVELHAFHYWAENFTRCPDDMPDIEHEVNSYALSSWGQAEPGSSLHLAVSAFSLAIFGRTRRIHKVLEKADKFYAQSIVKMQKEITDLSNERIDQLLITTMLMTNYEVCYFYFYHCVH